MSIKNSETRQSTEIQVEDRTVKGYAAIFNVLSNQMFAKGVPFKEILLPSAFDGLIEKNDVVAVFNHEEDLGILARSRNGVGTLQLTVDTKGLYFEFIAPNTPLGDSVLEGIRRGDLDGCSFVFIVEQGGEKWVRQADSSYIRTISKIGKLYDISVVVRQAYQEATVSTRGIELAEEEELEIYYKTLLNEIE